MEVLELMKNVLADTKLMLEYIWNTDKSIFIFKAVGILINTAQLLLGTIYIKWIVDSIVNNGELVSTIKLIIALQLLALALYSAMTLVERFIVPDKEYRIRHKLQNLFISKAMKHDLECYENPSFYDNYTKAIRVADTKALDFLDIIAKLVQNVLAAITMLSIVSVLSPVCLCLFWQIYCSLFMIKIKARDLLTRGMNQSNPLTDVWNTLRRSLTIDNTQGSSCLRAI